MPNRLCRYLPWNLLALMLVAGCATGPTAEYYSWNPFNRQGPEEEQYGPRPGDRREQYRELAGRARRMPPDEQSRTARELALRMQNEVDPLIRAEIVRVLGELPGPESADALRLAVKDSEAGVRVAACGAWRRHGGEKAVSVLSETIASDTSDDVRLAATRALGGFQDRMAVRGLSVALEDGNPALQYRAMEALKNSTGQDLGHDVVAWKTYIDSGTPPERRAPTLVERLTERF